MQPKGKIDEFLQYHNKNLVLLVQWKLSGLYGSDPNEDYY